MALELVEDSNNICYLSSGSIFTEYFKLAHDEGYIIIENAEYVRLTSCSGEYKLTVVMTDKGRLLLDVLRI